MFRFLTSGRDRDRHGERESSSSNSRSSSLGSASAGSRRRPQPSHPALEAVAASEVDGPAGAEDEVRLRRRRRKVNLSASQQQQSKKTEGKLPDDRPGGANSPSPATDLFRPSFVVGSRPSSVDTTASGATGADDERDYEDLEVDDEAEFEAELALLNRSRSSRSEPARSSTAASSSCEAPSTPATATSSAAISPFSHVISSAQSTAAAAMAHAHPNTPTTSTSASSVATTPQPHLINMEEAATSEAEAEEAHDEFCVNASPQPAKSLPYHRPVPVLHHFSLAPPPKGHPHKGAFHHLQINSGVGGRQAMPSPVQTPTSQPQSLQLVPGGGGGEEGAAAKNGSADPSSNAMSRSISDSTLRRAALHLNLNNQSVLPSFTSLQQFKKELSLSSRRPSTRGHRKSMIATTSPTLPRCHSPSVAAAAAQMVSPMDSPKVSPNQFAFANIKKADGRRWSVASLPSSGYGTTPGSSNVSSQCSSQERLHQLGAAAAPGHHHHHHHHHHHAAAAASIATAAPSSSATPAASSIASTPASAIHGDELRSMHRHFSSNESNPSLLEDDPNSSGGRRSPSIRPRSRSLSSPVRSPVVGGESSEIVLIATLYKERFPKATKQMEERLQNFISCNETLSSAASDIAADSVAIVRFVHHQVLEMARDCLQKSEDKLITSRYFYEMSENLEKLLIQTREKSTEAASHLTALIKKLLLIVSRPARLLECLEFDPEEFLQLLDAAEGHARGLHGVNANVPQYIISKLGLNRDPLAELRQDMSQLDTKGTSNNSESNNKIPTVEVVVEGDGDDNEDRPRQTSTPKKDDTEEDSKEEGASTLSASASDMSTSSASKKPSFKDPSDNDFEELKLISNGAYGAVYLVKHKETRQRFALKKINKQNLILRNQVDQVFAERDIMSFTDNPFVVSMYCSFETRKHLCMVMEYVEGGDCANLLKNMGPFPPDMARFYFAETVLAVEYLHSFGIVHRDLKPDNLLITALGHIKLTDFGLSKMGLMSLATNLYEGYIDKETKQFSDKQVFGTPEYIAPEVILRQGYGKPVDWWSMGIILYEFLIGCVPFFGDTPEELFAHTVNDDIEWPTEEDWPVPPEAKEIISALLMQNPLDRLGTAGSFDVKEHHYFFGVDWNSLLRMKADFIPQLEDEEDISYFDSRLDRYNHEMEQEDDSTNNRSSAEDTDDTQSMFASFTSASPRYRKATHGAGPRDPSLISHRHSMSVCESTPDTPVTTEHKVLSPELRRCQQQHIGRPEVGNAENRVLSASSSNSSSKTEISSAAASTAHLSCPDLENMVAKAASSLPTSQSESIPSRALQPPPSRQSSAPQSLSLTDSSQTESEDMSPLMSRRRKLHSGRDNHSSGSNSIPLPKFSISGDGPQLGAVPKSPLPVESSTGPRSLPVTPKLSVEPTTPSPLVTGSGGGARQKSLSVSQPSSAAATAAAAASLSSSSSSRPQMVKSSSATGLSLMIPADSAAAAAMAAAQSIQSPGGGSSTASSRDASPCRDLSPLINSLNAPIIVRRGPRGFGFTIRAIRVYFGDTDIYTVHHLVMEVDKGSPAFDAGLRPGDLVTHINGEPVQGLMHTQVLQLLISGGEAVTLRATALETTSIKTGGRRRDPQAIKMAKRSGAGGKRSGGGGKGGHRRSHHHGDKSRKTSLFRKLSSKKATAEMQQLAAAQSGASGNNPGMMRQSSAPGTPSPLASASITMSDSGHSDCSSSTCSPADSSPCSPAAGASPSTRPSSLHGLKHKLHVKTKTLHSPSRRHSHSGHIPLSPLARTPSPSPVPVSPTRSPSPLALPLTQHHVHPAGSSNTTQTYSPGASLTPNSAKKAFNAHRPKSAEPGSPLLRRALSPDRLHPRSDVKVKGTISPLCNPPPKLTVATGSQQQAITSRSGEVLSPLPSRATHTSPSTTPKTSTSSEPPSASGSVELAANSKASPSSQEAMIRKHSKSSLSQPTIPEEEAEEPEEQHPSVQPPADSKDDAKSTGVSKSEDGPSSSKGGKEKESTLQRMTKAIRGTSRSDSRSKKNREASTSPKSSVTRKDSLKKSAAEKRDMFKTLH